MPGLRGPFLEYHSLAPRRQPRGVGVPPSAPRGIDEIGGTLGADIHLIDMVLTPSGIEVAVDEHDGPPHVLGRVIVAFTWDDIADIPDQGMLSWLIDPDGVDP